MEIPQYLDPKSKQTLNEALMELRALEGADDAVVNLAPELREDIEIHDVIHVLFACKTDLASEVIAHIWTVFGTTYDVREMARVNMHQDHQDVLARIGHTRLLRMWIYRIPEIVQTLYRANQMVKHFPAQEYTRYLDKQLIEIRAEFGIRPIAPSLIQEKRNSGAALRTLHRDKQLHQAL
ncbi:hypothetical protein [Synechococcus sp. PCC 7336]|uniref:hypothetical protein n=1 Tax=Synechococcus sp. PCC 7336 TaxID=195250 RepID=UPI000364C9F4|nr:hypothetical protein [Synechococcus sp. PCC 7336]